MGGFVESASSKQNFRDGFKDRFRDEFRDRFTDAVTEPSLIQYLSLPYTLHCVSKILQLILEMIKISKLPQSFGFETPELMPFMYL